MDIYNTDYTQAEGLRSGGLEVSLRKDRKIGELQSQNFKRAHATGVKNGVWNRCGHLFTDRMPRNLLS